MADAKDPTQPMRLAASQLAGVDEGSACTQASFKVGKKAFLFIGPQGGRYKAMFKLDASMADARKRAAKEPDRFDVGSTGWVTARFEAGKVMPKTLWTKWLKESYALASSVPKKKAAKKRSTTKKAARR